MPVSSRVAEFCKFVAAHPRGLATKGLYNHVSPMMCWDAALYCAWKVGAIHTSAINERPRTSSGILGPNHYDHFFTDTTPIEEADVAGLPKGCMLGFIDNTGRLIHVMIYTGNGKAVGSNNGSVFGQEYNAFQKLDLADFFSSDARTQRGITMVAQPLTGQRV
jgi:hypothetical protein